MKKFLLFALIAQRNINCMLNKNILSMLRRFNWKYLDREAYSV
ncbi:hypothetical protein BH20BAC1_BH20BAC1_28840 [soil metagenome]